MTIGGEAPITAPQWDLPDRGRHAAAMLLQRMQGTAPDGFRCLKPPTRLVPRDSCRALPLGG